MADQIEINAAKWIEPEMAVTESAERAAEAINHALSESDRVMVEVNLCELRGIPSSYFNLLLRRVAEAHGISAIDRVRFKLGSVVQQRVYERSAQAVRDSYAA